MDDQKISHPLSINAPSPVAIVGMAMRLPDGIRTEEQFWDTLIRGQDTHGQVPESRYKANSYFCPTGRPGTIPATHGHFLKDDLGKFDASFFSMNSIEAAQLDPQQKLLLEVVWECLQNAGQANYMGELIGCYVGSFGEDWLEISRRDAQCIGAYHAAGTQDFALSNRISYEYDFRGPSVTIRTGCSSAMVALHQACQALHNRDCVGAVVAGANLILAPSNTIIMGAAGAISTDGKCKTFDASANGYGRGEAINAVFIKRLDDAIRDGDPIRAVIRATATNSDGKTTSLAVPSPHAQEQMIKHAYKVANIHDISQTGFFECHGTGTPVGDKYECRAVARAFENQGVYIGSVKPNVGHSEGASGLTSLIKVVLALERGIIPPNVNFTTPNPEIPFTSGNLRVPTEPTPWPEDRLKRASINSFGIGGANAHAIVDSAAEYKLPKTTGSSGLKLILCSASNRASLDQNMEQIRDYIEENSNCISDIAYTLGLRRVHLKHRAFTVHGAGDASFCNEIPNKQPKLNFTFTGQGAQWRGMGRELMQWKAFRDQICRMDQALQETPMPPSWSLEGKLFPERIIVELEKLTDNTIEVLRSEDDTFPIDEPEYAQPICTAFQVGIVELLASWGIRPDAVVGHSSGEIAAAYAAGAITSEEAIKIAFYRGLAVRYHPSSTGAMAAVAMSKEAAAKYLNPSVAIACENSPESITLSGNAEYLEGVLHRIKVDVPSVRWRMLNVPVAYHSHYMRAIGTTYERFLLGSIEAREAPIRPLFSSVTQEVQTNGIAFDPAYWRQNLESPVRFHGAVLKMLKASRNDENVVFLEIGPHSVLSAPLREISRSKDNTTVYIPTVIRDTSPVTGLFRAVGHLHLQSVAIDLLAINGTGNVLTDIPPYKWDHGQNLWSESHVARSWRLLEFPHHEILGSRVPESTSSNPVWRNRLSLRSASWIQDHQIQNSIIFPCAGYIAAAGEAIRQISGSMSYTIRHLLIKEPLVLSDETVVDMVTSFSIAALTDFENSQWYKFTISSYRGESWVDHCTGEVSLGSSQPAAHVTEDSCIEWNRHVQQNSWYKSMAKVGYHYGQHFQQLHEIMALSASNQASASVATYESTSTTSSYLLHPVVIDNCLQLFSVALSRGLSYRLDRLVVPVRIDCVCVRANSDTDGSPIAIQASATPIKRGIIGKVEGSNDNGLTITIQGCSMVQMGEDMKRRDPLEAYQQMWHPLQESLPTTSLVSTKQNPRDEVIVLEELVLLCILESAYIAKSQTIVPAHMERFAKWLQTQADRLQLQGSPLIPIAMSWANSDSMTRLRLIEERIAAVTGKMETWKYELVLRVFRNIIPLLTGKISSIELLYADDGLKGLYSGIQEKFDCSSLFSTLGYEAPGMKVLEIGSGTGGFTEHGLKSLSCPSGTYLYSKYTFTDISPGFFPAAQERFREYPNLEFLRLDISQDPLPQGFASDEYDVITASNVLHATPSLSETLRNVYKLLKPGGKLLIVELCPVIRYINYVMGTFPGWWVGENDNRAQEPYVTPERWDRELRNTGFTGTDIVVYDQDKPFHSSAIITATKMQQPHIAPEIEVLCLRKEGNMVQRVKDRLSRAGYTVQLSELNETDNVSSKKPIISLLDIEDAFLDDISESRWQEFKNILARAESAGILWVTRAVQMSCSDPRYALGLGVARTVRNELGTDIVTLETDTFDDGFLETLLLVYTKTLMAKDHTKEAREFEFAYQDGKTHISRYHPSSASEYHSENPKSMDIRTLSIGVPGDLSTLQWVPDWRKEPQGDDVLVDIHYSALNFKDVLEALGTFGENVEVGFEASGIIRQTGPSSPHHIGQRVIVMAQEGLFSTRVVVPSRACIPIPDSMSLPDAAAFPCVYGTVILGLLYQGSLRKGQTILIHSACGGVGLAAIAISKMQGAEIYATVGSDAKAEYLNNRFGIPMDRIFNSHSQSFEVNLMKATKGRGVDVVLNSLAGELLHASWRCVAPFGKMIEIGKKDLMGHGSLSLAPFLENRSFICVSLDKVLLEHPEIYWQVITDGLKYIQQGLVEPIRPIRLFPATEIEQAFRHMQKGEHIGKVLIQMPENPAALPASPDAQLYRFSPQASYLVIGGLGGIGRSVSRWMVDNEAQGCRCTVVQGSVAVQEDVQKAVQSCVHPLKGIFHMAMSLKDKSFSQMTHNEWHTALEAKVTGTWNLHHALRQVEGLEFFLLFSSASGILGQPGQANYAAANVFMDAFVQYRHSLGLPASVIDIGVVGDVGYVSENIQSGQALKTAFQGYKIITEYELLQAIHLSLTQQSDTAPMSRMAIGLSPVDDPHRPTVLCDRDIRMRLLLSKGTEKRVNASDSSEIPTLLRKACEDPEFLGTPAAIGIVHQEIVRKLNSFSTGGDSIGLQQPFHQVGLDSLVMTEMRIWIQRAFHIEMGIPEILGARHIDGLSQIVLQKLEAKCKTM
ncbi:putative polyketide synthase [Aspergillus transmontanensis]|uniref:Putative polyketide synthase n=1 Tax=Aspergillus transmontanensis TaxID=1034304 RepID=A0A5N6VTE1_9EURO|nr:putative polyketide synthase [Aspergillus transmontanensis]